MQLHNRKQSFIKLETVKNNVIPIVDDFNRELCVVYEAGVTNTNVYL